MAPSVEEFLTESLDTNEKVIFCRREAFKSWIKWIEMVIVEKERTLQRASNARRIIYLQLRIEYVLTLIHFSPNFFPDRRKILFLEKYNKCLDDQMIYKQKKKKR